MGHSPSIPQKRAKKLAPMSSASSAKYFGNILYLGFCRPSIERTIVAHLQYQGVLDDGLVAKMLSELRVDVVSSPSTIRIQQCMMRTNGQMEPGNLHKLETGSTTWYFVKGMLDHYNDGTKLKKVTFKNRS